MGFLNNLLHGPAVLAMKNAEPETPTIMDSMPEAISWPTDAEFAGYANGMYCREYAVRVVVDFISRQLASLPLKVYRKNADGDAEEVRDGALAKLIRHPSDLPGMSRYRFYATLIRDMLLEDRWLCTLGSNRAGDGNTLRRIPPDGYSLTANGFGELTGVTISSVAENKGGTYRLPDPRIVLDIGYIDGLNLGDPITDVLRPLLAEARVMAKYRKSIAENGYQIPAYVYRPKEMPWESQADYDDFTQGLRNYVAGGGMAGTWPVFKDGMEIRTVDNLIQTGGHGRLGGTRKNQRTGVPRIPNQPRKHRLPHRHQQQHRRIQGKAVERGIAAVSGGVRGGVEPHAARGGGRTGLLHQGEFGREAARHDGRPVSGALHRHRPSVIRARGRANCSTGRNCRAATS